jgi:hypothetical protein
VSDVRTAMSWRSRFSLGPKGGYSPSCRELKVSEVRQASTHYLDRSLSSGRSACAISSGRSK